MEFLNKIKNFFTRISASLGLSKTETSKSEENTFNPPAPNPTETMMADLEIASKNLKAAKKALEKLDPKKSETQKIEEIGHDVLLTWQNEKKRK